MVAAHGRQLAIITDPRFGVGAHGKTALWFTVTLARDQHVGSLQVFHDPIEVFCIIETYGVDDIKQLAGQFCWVEYSSNMIKWIEPSLPTHAHKRKVRQCI
jgi:hypothetical protein